MRKITIATLAVTIVLILAASAGAMMARRRGVKTPPASEFGTGPRTSQNGLYIVSLQDARSLAPRKMYTIKVLVYDAETRPLSDAAIAVDGGMPQHGHGLPTRPRITKNLGAGFYELSGLRFNMGGWWELKLAITTAAGTDTVTFNLKV